MKMHVHGVKKNGGKIANEDLKKKELIIEPKLLFGEAASRMPAQFSWWLSPDEACESGILTNGARGLLPVEPSPCFSRGLSVSG